MLEDDSLISKQVLLPDTSRGLEPAQWKTKPVIEALQLNGLTDDQIEKELQSIHDIAYMAYRESEIICSKLWLQILANFSLLISATSFIAFISTALICIFLNQIKAALIKYHDEHYLHTIVDQVTMQNVITLTVICSVIIVIFGGFGAYILYQSSRNKLNQYIESILAVHEHIYDRLSTKWEKHGIIWKLITHKKTTKRPSVFDTKQNITYYGIVVKLLDDEDFEDYCDFNDADFNDLIYDSEKDKKAQDELFNIDRPSNSDMIINEEYYDKNSLLNPKKKKSFKTKVFNFQRQNKSYHNHHSMKVSMNPYKRRLNAEDIRLALSENDSKQEEIGDELSVRLHNVSNQSSFDAILSPTDCGSSSAYSCSVDIKVEKVPLLVLSGSELKRIGSRVKLTDS